MAQRFGGKYSPDSDEADTSSAAPLAPKAERARGAARVNLLYLAPIPLLFSAFGHGATGMALDLGAAAVLVFGVYTLSEGLKAEAAYEARKVARRPALPRKILAAALAGFGVFLASFSHQTGGILEPLIYGAVAVALHLTAFGIDPLANKNVDGVDDFQRDRVARVVDEAEEQLARMGQAIAKAGDRKLERRVEGFQATARHMCRTVEEDPRDLTAARKFLVVYLQGAAEATVKFADIYSRRRDPEARANYIALLDDLERNFSAKTETLLVSDRAALDVEIEVLRDRLQREGVRMN
ncbi:5-bromo-4-chloroindolyl phosphate hydrolysis family protein [Tropicimonas isoalkanivorans]|uniref:5-bromo-4-chloroindolyl phosphate hydrolysis protein n=1 Tax=Tropicimonas isoalkanivorans TaxID=441112 RepID=A0A1I1JRL3_9RHOB|nr:5-bromo-4-chloroindolyl phosphate hydrolysis family protein [Tropicimonas isoalkanivorans]SFC51289.1 5-bromo-4-chloroindolyl phosphate hydrolysis protein [Tropicimonas isoalkanivorans]